MKIQIRIRGVDERDSVRDLAERQARFSLDRLEGELDEVVVRVADVNGPRGGVDKRCYVSLRGRRLGLVSVEGRHSIALGAVGATLERAAHAAHRRLERLRAMHRPIATGGF